MRLAHGAKRWKRVRPPPNRTAGRPLVVRYPLVTATLLVGICGLILAAAGLDTVAAWGVGSYCALIATVTLGEAIREIARGTWGLDILAVTAVLSTLAVGDIWASLVVVLMITTGSALEDYAVERARLAITSLLRQAPRVAHRVLPDASVVDIPVDDVAVGDRLHVYPGESLPVNATLESAECSVDESSLTGESLPVTRRCGETLLSGAINGATVIEVRADALARDSEFQKIVDLVEAASNSKAPFVRMADRYAIPFTLFAYALAGVAWALSGDPVRFAEVLVVATPCPLLIAVPVAFIAGMNRAATVGVIVRSGGAFEQLARIRSAAFDKTGTLTSGTPLVDRVEPCGNHTVDDVLRYAAAVEESSSHVLARAVVDEARGRGVTVRPGGQVRELAGKGIVAEVERHSVVVGKADFVNPGGDPVRFEPLRAGEMAIYASVDGSPAGRIVLRDRTRANAHAVVSSLRQLGVVRIMMLTGDGADTAAHVAAQVGITEVHASLLPADKVAQMVSASPRPLMMVGDGVNDAPVLAAADVGIAMGARGATAASETADVVILLDDLSRVVDVVRIARRTITVAVQGIWVGIGLSCLLMVVAAFGLIPAIIGAALQELVDVATIVNGLRARRAAPSASLRSVPAIAPKGQS